MRGRVALRLRAEWESVHRPQAAAFSLDPFVVLASAAALLTLLQFHGTAGELGPILAWLERGQGRLASAATALYRGPWFELASYAYWSLACFAGYLLVPAQSVPGQPEGRQRLAGRSAVDFAAWQALYALQFVSLEFFFRGFLVHTLKRDLGAHAVFVAVVPYCMIHFQKPLPEALGAIVAGIVLGTLSLRTGSVLGGAAVHVAVALTMDVLALAQKVP